MGLLLLLCFSACSYTLRSVAGNGPFVQDPELEWGRMETVIGKKMTRAHVPRSTLWKSRSSSGSSIPVAKKVPEYQIVSTSVDEKGLFEPEKGARPLPQSVMEMLLVTAPPELESERPSQPKTVELLCHIESMYVRIRRDVFRSKDAYKYLKLGTCPVNQGTNVHYYLLHLLKTDCGFEKESNENYLSVSNVLHYKPPGPVLREMPFDISLQCKYARLFHSYKVGFYPKLEGGTVFRALHPKCSYTLTSEDASGNELNEAKTYMLGQLMYFEAKQSDKAACAGDQRLYINMCFMTASKDPTSNPKYTIIDNQGCMIDGKLNDQSEFLPGASKMTQKFSVGAFIFEDKVSSSSTSQKLYMHCEISLGKLTPTESSKACSYDPATKKWKELYGDDSVCECCESSCSTQPRASRNMVSSHSWKVDMNNKGGPVAFNPRMKSINLDTFSLEDPDMAEHKDFLNYWKQD